MDEPIDYTQVNLETQDKIFLRVILEGKLDYYNSMISSLENQLKPLQASKLRALDLISKISH